MLLSSQASRHAENIEICYAIREITAVQLPLGADLCLMPLSSYIVLELVQGHRSCPRLQPLFPMVRSSPLILVLEMACEEDLSIQQGPCSCSCIRHRFTVFAPSMSLF